MRKKTVIFLPFIISVSILLGCASVGNKIEQDKVSQIKEGVTTGQEVVSLLGTPYMKTLDSNGKTIMLYQYTKVKNRASNFIPIVNIFGGGMDMRQQMLTILVDKEGKVEKYTLNDTNTEINSGLTNTK
ncbi:MAG: outer membrane protein assembly factor BamE [Candidatus Omnitrophica bacterium]|nr:outer membrane protein assembly factor BamE [Candidatus Omnitrophota bacterium]MDD5592141.1 outer membrane protein assembly factor BamE [Candidatus Omnitrophota bacterium]